jgi:antitoxin component of RelBE/YafQ-DinJ toxin-antitoxin module
MNELPFEKNIPRTPAEIFQAIDNQSVNQKTGASLIERYGDHRVREALEDIQEKMGIELSEEVGQKMNHIGQLIDEFFQKMIFFDADKHKKGKRKT